MVDINGKPVPCQPIEFNHVRIIPPEGYEIDKENSTFDNIVFKKQKDAISYKQVLASLFHYRSNIYSDNSGIVYDVDSFIKCNENHIVLNKRENYQRLVALTKLINIAEHFNQGKIGIYAICIDSTNKIRVTTTAGYYGQVFFYTDQLAKRAIEILGEKTIRLALGK